MPPSEIRKEAREALRGKWGKGVSITLAFWTVSFIMGFIQGLVGKGTILYKILEIVVSVINVPLSFGLLITFIELKRGEDVNTFNFLKEGFSRFSRAWGIILCVLSKLWLPLICLIICLFFLIASFGAIASSFLFTAFYIFLIVYMIMQSLLYVLAYYISFDNPELSSKECVKKSEELMKGNRGNYFMLSLSFIGWVILAAFSFGIGMLWLTPYMQVAILCFYEKIAKVETINAEPVEKVEE